MPNQSNKNNYKKAKNGFVNAVENGGVSNKEQSANRTVNGQNKKQ